MPVPGGDISTSEIWVKPAEVVEDSTIEETAEETTTDSD